MASDDLVSGTQNNDELELFPASLVVAAENWALNLPSPTRST
jgi:hypothetical protein